MLFLFEKIYLVASSTELKLEVYLAVIYYIPLYKGSF